MFIYLRNILLENLKLDLLFIYFIIFLILSASDSISLVHNISCDNYVVGSTIIEYSISLWNVLSSAVWLVLVLHVLLVLQLQTAHLNAFICIISLVECNTSLIIKSNRQLRLYYSVLIKSFLIMLISSSIEVMFRHDSEQHLVVTIEWFLFIWQTSFYIIFDYTNI